MFSMALFLSSCGLLKNEDQTQTDSFWYKGGFFNSDNKISYVIHTASSWGPSSSHTDSSFSKELYSSATTATEPELIFNFGATSPTYLGEVHTAVLSDNSSIVTWQENQQYEARIHDLNGTLLSTTSISSTPNNISISPDESKIAISTKGSFYIFNKTGATLKLFTTGGYFVWKSNSEGYFFNTESNKLSVYNYDSDSITDINSNFKPLQYNVSTLELYSIEGLIFKTLNTETLSIASDDLTSITSGSSATYPIVFKYPNISSDGNKIIMDGSFGINDKFGIYMLDRTQDSLQVLFENRSKTHDK